MEKQTQHAFVTAMQYINQIVNITILTYVRELDREFISQFKHMKGLQTLKDDKSLNDVYKNIAMIDLKIET